MSSPLVAVPQAPASQEGSVVSAGDWFPAIDCNQVRAELRLGEVVTHARLMGALRGGMLTVLRELTDWTATQILAGFDDLGSVRPEPQIDGEPAIELAFRRAVQFHAAAELAELHRDLSATVDGQARADSQILSAADYRRMATHALRDVLGTTRTAVELI